MYNDFKSLTFTQADGSQFFSISSDKATIYNYVAAATNNEIGIIHEGRVLKHLEGNMFKWNPFSVNQLAVYKVTR